MEHDVFTEARNDVVECARTYRESKCRYAKPFLGMSMDDRCVGENHVVDCPVEVARGDLISAVDRLTRLERPH